MSTTIGEIIAEYGGSIKTGPFGTTLKASEYTSTGVPLISVKEIGAGTFHIDDKTPRVDEKVTLRLPEYLLEKGDIVFARKGSVERSAIVGEDQVGWFLGSDGIRLRLPTTVNAQYVKYWISQGKIKNWLHQHSTGSTMASLNQKTIARIPILLPSPEQQTLVADILHTFDDKIELNRRMNETLEAMARAVFRDWFVDFGPTRRKAASETDPVAILGGILPDPAKATELAALFPDRFGDNGLPEGWEEREVGSFAKLKGGKQLPKTEFVEDGDIPVFGGAGHMGNTDKANASGYVISVGRVGAYCGNFVAHRGLAWINNNASFFELKNGTKPEWFFYALRGLDLTTIRKGAAQPFVSNGDIAKLSLVFPGDPVLETFQGILLPLVQLIEANEKENQTVAATRDLLLPKLMSGEIRLKGAEAEV
ncbi:restriction endonuclease subunit S [Sulfitobacter sp. M368]|uniref:restriction endonuclease subunit S n=1 Tax=Sulfitobacter sp. M368 TaxID=2867021 RepID=UPI0021A6C7A1|nr:restriction endonuclease subunit S [Sulfitobacter sp. M368]UWR15597.1 restriction endonuclease subunit S [Sulfitobacter sp. M368]